MASVSFPCLLFILLTVRTGYGLTCYKCDSSESFFCNYGIASFVLPTVDCQTEAAGAASFIPKQCVKITAKDKDNKEYVARGCVPYSGSACDYIVKTFGFFNGLMGGPNQMNCHTCDGDKCNSSHKITALTFGAIFLAALTRIF